MENKQKKFEFTRSCVFKFTTMLVEKKQDLKNNINSDIDVISSQVILNQTNRVIRELVELKKIMHYYNLR